MTLIIPKPDKNSLKGGGHSLQPPAPQERGELIEEVIVYFFQSQLLFQEM